MSSPPRLPQNIVQWISEPDDKNLQATRELSRKIDHALGYNILDTEILVGQENYQAQNWLHLNPQDFQTPYQELFSLVNELYTQKTHWVDLGAAYGRLGLIILSLFKDMEITSYEISQARVTEAKRIYELLHLNSNTIYQQDISLKSFLLPQADIYFIYDYGHREHIQKTLKDLQSIARQKAITVVARGRGTRHWIDTAEPWLSQVIAPTHKELYSIYRSSDQSY